MGPLPSKVQQQLDKKGQKSVKLKNWLNFFS